MRKRQRLKNGFWWDTFPQDVEQRVEAIDQQHGSCRRRSSNILNSQTWHILITEFCQRVNHGLKQATFEQKRRLVELLIDRVVVTNEEVEIRYVIPISSESEQIRFCHLLTDYSGEEEREACSAWSPKRFTTLER